MSPTQRLAAWLYERPRLRRAWKVCCALWFCAAWALAAAPSASATPYAPTGPSIAGGQFLMAWTGLHDTYGVPVSDYFVSTVAPTQAGAYAWDQSHCGFNNFGGCFAGLPSSFGAVMSNILASGMLATECSILLFVGAAGIWLIKFALSAPWLAWLVTIATPIVNQLNVMLGQLYVIPIALLVCILVGGVVALTRGWGRGLGMIFGGFLVILLIYLLFRHPMQEVLGPNGVLGIGQYLGFMVAEGAVHNGPLAPGGSGASLDTLTSLLCDVLLREPIQMINFNTVVDDIPACAHAWSASIMTGQISAPANAMASCGDPAALAYADQLSLGTAGWFLVVILVEIVVMLALVYVGFHVIAIGFKAFANVLVLVVAAPLGVAPGPPRRFACRKAQGLIIDGVEMLATTAGLGIIAIIMGEVTTGSVPGMTGMSSPIAKLMMMLVLAVAGAFAYHHMLVSFRHGHGGLFRALGEFGKNLHYTEYLLQVATGRSFPGFGRSGKESNNKPHDNQETKPQPVDTGPDPGAPGRSGHPPPSGGPTPGPQPQPPGGGAGGVARTAFNVGEAVVAPEAQAANLVAGQAAGRFAGQAGRFGAQSPTDVDRTGPAQPIQRRDGGGGGHNGGQPQGRGGEAGPGPGGGPPGR